MGALGLVLNSIVLLITIYLDAAMQHLRRRRETILPGDVTRLWPLGFEHLNMLGRYSFDLPESVRNGHLRPLQREGRQAR